MLIGKMRRATDKRAEGVGNIFFFGVTFGRGKIVATQIKAGLPIFELVFGVKSFEYGCMRFQGLGIISD